MKVLQLCGKDFFGAGRAAYRLHKGLLDAGVDCQMWVGAKRTDDNTVVDIHKDKLTKKWTKAFVKIEKYIIKGFAGGAKEMFSIGHPGHSVRKRIEADKPDVIHLHWLNRGFVNIKELKDLDIPIVISLHDMWWFTGGCHYDEECGRYIEGCGKCPVLRKDSEHGLSFRHLRNKRQILSSVKNITLIGLSTWMKSCAEQSLIGKDTKVIQLPNGIDISKFAPLNKMACREKHGLPKDKKLIMFAAVDVLSETRKGYKYISEALKQFNPEEYELVVIGEKSKEISVSGLKTYFLGEINDDKLLIEYMSAVDVSVVPSLQENLSNLIMESMACETPVVAFNIGGNGDMIKHRHNGYLASDKNINDLGKGIKFCSDIDYNSNLSKAARQTVVDKFDIQHVTNKYIELYKSLIQ